jgi:hypothetical protein
MSVFWAYLLSENSAPFSSMPHMSCIPAIGSLYADELRILYD